MTCPNRWPWRRLAGTREGGGCLRRAPMAASGRVQHSVPRVTCREHPYHPPRGVLAATPLPWESAPARPVSRSADSGPSLPQGDSCSTRTLSAPGSRERRGGGFVAAPPRLPPPNPSLFLFFCLLPVFS